RHTRFKCDWSSDVCSSDLGWHGSRRVECWVCIRDGHHAAVRSAPERRSPARSTARRAEMVAPIAGRRKRRTGWLSVLVIGAMAVLLGPSAPAAAQAPVKAPVVDQCTAKEWANPFNLKDCVGKLSKV